MLDPHPHLTVFFQVWAAVGPMVGIMVGYLLTSRQQLRQWKRDNVKQECREIVEGLTDFRFALHAAWGPTEVRKEEDLTQSAVRDEFRNRGIELQRMLASRILINDEIRKSRMASRLSDAIDVFKASYFKDQKASHDRLRDTLFVFLDEVVLIAKRA
ncbi:MAG: hypothetical protein JST28_24185 [Acidobacteria bacterium]|nr:hypothetical protein [Acidobacteriota bacterium]